MTKARYYEAIRMWHVDTGSYPYYWENLQEVAAAQDAPLDSIFQETLENGTKRFVTASDLKPGHPFREKYFQGNPDLEAQVRAAIWLRFQSDAPTILKHVKWDNLNGCWYVTFQGMFYGIEKDGYIHT